MNSSNVTTKPTQTSDSSNLTIMSCSNVTILDTTKSDSTNITTKNCSKVSNSDNITNNDRAPLNVSPKMSDSINITMKNCSKVTNDANIPNDDRAPLNASPKFASNQKMIGNLAYFEKKSLKLGISVTKSDENGHSSSRINNEICLSNAIDSNHSNSKQKKATEY